MQFSEKQSFELPKNIKEMLQKIIDYGGEAFVIGGAIRDMVLDIEPADYDIFCNLTGEQILKVFPNGNIIGGEERQEKILTVIVDGVEVSQYRRNGDRTETGTDLDTHLSTCDFTCNSMAMTIDGNIIDKYGGKNSLEWNDLMFVGNGQDRIDEDPLRLLRGLRFMAKYDLFPVHDDEDTHDIIFQNFAKLQVLPIERVRDEFKKIIELPDGFDVLNDYGFFEMFFPEVENLLTLKGGHYHLETVHEHSKYCLWTALDLTDNHLIHLAALLHDIGKDAASEEHDEKGMTFHSHEKHSHDMVIEIMNRFKYGAKEIKYVSTMVKHHMMGPAENMTDKTVIKITNELEDAGITVEDMLIMRYSDNQANLNNPRMKFNEFYQENNWLRRVYKMKYQRLPFRTKDLEITGHDVMEHGIEGPEIGKMLKIIFDEVVEAKLKNDRPALLCRLRELVK